MTKKIVICDFDGTITKRDTLDLFLEKYAHPDWHIWEKKWFALEIGSRDCIRKQFDLIENMTQDELDKFLKSVEIDDYFLEFYSLAKKNNVKIAIVSDGFDLIIDTIMKNNGIDDIDVYTNHLEFKDGEFIMQWPNISMDCKKESGTCKCKIVNRLKDNYDEVFYVGDSVSDYCVSDKADYLFAKHRLLTYCEEKNIKYIPYETFNDIIKNENLGLRNVNNSNTVNIS